MKIYIAGKITGVLDPAKLFNAAAQRLRAEGHEVMNPSILPEGFEQHEYLKICFAMIDVCDAIYMLNNWEDSLGANKEIKYATCQNKEVQYE